MDFLGTRNGLILIVGERLWTAIDALAQWGDQLNRIHLLVTPHDADPGGPLDRIEALIRESFPDVEVRLHDPIEDDQPLALLYKVGTIAADGLSYLLDASAATRLMFAGALLAAQHVPRVVLINRDVDGPWYEIGPTGAARELEGLDPSAVDRFTVAGLLSVTWSDDMRDARILDEDIDPEISEAARRALDGEDWKAEFDAAAASVMARRRIGQGLLFERFVLCLIREMGVQADDVAVGAVLYDGARAVQEVDVVVNCNGRLHVIDCKLSDPEQQQPIGVQIRDAFATKMQIGDGADQFILLRPHVTFDEEFRSLCDAYDIRVIDRATLARVSLAEAISTLIRPPNRVGRATPISARSVRLPVDGGTINLHAEFVQSRTNIRIYDLSSILIVKVSLDRDASGPGLQRQFERILGNDASILSINRNGSKANNRSLFTITIQPVKSRYELVRDQLAELSADRLFS